MSIYSGFATRQQEEAYDESIATLLYLMQKRLFKFYKNEPANDLKFIDLLMKIYNNIRNMEDSKYLQPKLSSSIVELIELSKVKRQQLAATGEDKDGKNQQSDTKQSKISLKKPTPQSAVQFQTNKLPPKRESQKINFTQRIAQNSQNKMQSHQKNNVIRKRVNSNSHHRSVFVSTSSQSNLKNADIQITKPLVFDTPKSKAIDIKKEKAPDKNQAKQDRKQGKEVKEDQKMEREDVRELIKGYLVKRKKYYGKEHEFRRQQINDIFKDP